VETEYIVVSYNGSFITNVIRFCLRFVSGKATYNFLSLGNVFSMFYSFIFVNMFKHIISYIIDLYCTRIVFLFDIFIYYSTHQRLFYSAD